MARDIRLVVWTPRALSALMCVFLSLFALDAFSPEKTWLEGLADFAVHVTPVAVLAALVAVAWRHAIVGAAVFAAAALLYAWMAWGHPSWILVIAGPLALISALFYLSWRADRSPSSLEGAP